MTILQGRVKANEMMAMLHTTLTKEGYKEISSNVATDGKVYKTDGENGTSTFYIQLIDYAHYISVSVYEKYTPDASIGLAGVFVNGRVLQSIIWSNTILPQLDVDYIINVNKDRMIIYAEGESTDSRSTAGLTYVGLPIRYDSKDTTGNFAGIAALGSVGNVGVAWYALKGRAITPQTAYTYSYYTPTKSFGMGNQLFASPIILGNASEGPRGEIDDLLIVKTPDGTYEARHRDTFIRDGKTYVMIGKFYNASGTLPNAWYAIRI